MTSPHLASPSLAARYLAGYPPELIAQADALHREGRLAEHLARRYPEPHEVRSARGKGFIEEDQREDGTPFPTDYAGAIGESF